MIVARLQRSSGRKLRVGSGDSVTRWDSSSGVGVLARSGDGRQREGYYGDAGMEFRRWRLNFDCGLASGATATTSEGYARRSGPRRTRRPQLYIRFLGRTKSDRRRHATRGSWRQPPGLIVLGLFTEQHRLQIVKVSRSLAFRDPGSRHCPWGRVLPARPQCY